MTGKSSKNWSRRRFLGAAALSAVSAGRAHSIQAAVGQQQFVRIGTGPASGTYFPFGGVLATAISNPPGTRECLRGGICGVPGLIAVTYSSEGSVSNVESLALGGAESALCQADIAHWASSGQGPLAGRDLLGGVMSITSLYEEAIHIVVAANRGIWKIADLKGKRVSIDLPGSGTNVEARLILKAHDLEPEDLELFELPPGESADRLAEEEIDGFFLVSGTPATAIRQLAEDHQITLLPVSGEAAAALRAQNPFLSEATISAGTYFNVPFVRTLSVRALWLVSERLPEDLVHAMTEAFWDPRIQKLIGLGHHQGSELDTQAALKGTAETPLHPGAQRYYQENGLTLINPPRLG
ncbi:MAG: TAXI family TRAP transporter solute-binding subunit [Kiloniellales bacterium]|nr:TAXI family TRAP transporter solute-binding subunit [Kiloniellales bacterium]